MKNLKQHTEQVQKASRFVRKKLNVKGSNHSIPKTQEAEWVLKTASKEFKVSVNKLKLVLQ